jgi:predicted TPR repeat methyltransferase
MTDLFDEKAKDWDADEMKKKLSATIGSSILNNVGLHDQMLVMDFGAGTGLISAQVAPHVKKIDAVDISAAMLDKLVAKLQLHGKVEAICQDILQRPIDKAYDLVMSAMALHHVEDTSKLMQIFAEHLKSGGLIALADLDKEDGDFHPENTQGVYHFGFARDQLQSLLEKHGFEKVQFFTAYTIDRNNKVFPVFLVTATKI